MYRKLMTTLLCLTLFAGSTMAHAAPTSCYSVRFAQKQIDAYSSKLEKEYPGTLLYYAFALAALKEANPRNVQQAIAGLSAAYGGCLLFIDSRSCNFVAGRLTSLLTAQGTTCAFDSEMNCGVC